MRGARRARALLALAPLCLALTLRPDEAIEHVGEQAVVCGTVASAIYAPNLRGQPTVLHLGTPYPRHVFTVMIRGADRPRFSSPPEALGGRTICVRGTIRSSKGKARVEVTDPSQIEPAPAR